MWIQSVNKDDVERVWVNATNTSAATITAHWPAFKFVGGRPAASVAANEVALHDSAYVADGAYGSFVGLAYEDVPSGSIGVFQVYGYHESIPVMRIVGNVTVIPGQAIGPGVRASVGFSSVGLIDNYGPVVALDTIGATLHSLGTVGQNYANHVFIRAL